jgi:hypothetical protein
VIPIDLEAKEALIELVGLADVEECAGSETMLMN